MAHAEAQAERKDILYYNTKSPGAEDYLSLAREFLTRVETIPTPTAQHEQEV